MATLTDESTNADPSTTEAPSGEIDFSTAAMDFGIPQDEPAETVEKDKANSKSTGETGVDHPVNPAPEQTPAEEKPAKAEKPEKLSPEQVKRKFDGFDPDDIEPLKKAPNHVYNHFAKKLPELYKAKAELEELKKQEVKSAQERYLLDDDAYQQSPEYKSYSNAVENVDTEVFHWRNQLEALDAGQKAYGLSFKGDKLDLSKPVEYVRAKNEVSRAHVLEQFTAARARLESLTAQRDNIAGQYKQQQSAYLGEAKAAATKYFGWADKLEGKQKEELDVLRQQLGPLAKGFAGETTVRAIYTSKVLMDKVNELNGKLAQLSKQNQKITKANPLQFSGRSNREGEQESTANLYEGITPESFQ